MSFHTPEKSEVSTLLVLVLYFSGTRTVIMCASAMVVSRLAAEVDDLDAGLSLNVLHWPLVLLALSLIRRINEIPNPEPYKP